MHGLGNLNSQIPSIRVARAPTGSSCSSRASHIVRRSDTPCFLFDAEQHGRHLPNPVLDRYLRKMFKMFCAVLIRTSPLSRCQVNRLMLCTMKCALIPCHRVGHPHIKDVMIANELLCVDERPATLVAALAYFNVAWVLLKSDDDVSQG